MENVFLLLICAVIILVCVCSSKVLYRFGVPALLIFLVLGMLCGSDGIFKIQFDDYNLANEICSFGLVLIMFYGGIGANWKTAKATAPQAILMSTLGVLLTALLTGLFSYLVLKTSLLEGLLLGAVVGSTDAASVFSILRSRKLNLKGGLSSLLEIESGSNDPCAYMLTAVILSLLSGGGEPILLLLAKQLFFGVGIGWLLAKVTIFLLKRVHLEIEGLYPIFVLAVAVLTYSLSSVLGGNGYLGVYIAGILIGNAKIPHKVSLVRFFDGISWLMQIMLFFVLGLLSFPSQLPAVTLSGILISLFMMLIARPAATFAILSFFKTPWRQQVLVSFAGLRGAASIVFAVYAVIHPAHIGIDIFHIVFFIALFSVSLQGTLLPVIAKKLNLVDSKEPVLKTFNDYEETLGDHLYEVTLSSTDPWTGKPILEAEIPEGILIVVILRHGNSIVPKGSTVLEDGDTLVLSGEGLSELPIAHHAEIKK